MLRVRPCVSYNVVQRDGSGSGGGDGDGNYGYGDGDGDGYGYGGNYSYGTYGYGPFLYGFYGFYGSYGSYGSYGYSSGDDSGECGGGLCCVGNQPERHPPYSTNEECVISVASGNTRFIKMMDFETDVGDVLIVNGVNYSGYNGPSGVIPTGEIIWSTDDVQGPPLRGFAFCLDAQEPPVAEANSTFAWKVLSGRCAVDTDGCITSPNFPDRYDQHGCTIGVDVNNTKRLSVSNFETETGYDFLEINGRPYSGTYTSADVLDPPQGLIRWVADTNFAQQGWRLCLTDEVSNQTTWRSQDFPEQKARAFASAVWDAEKQLLLVYGGQDAAASTTTHADEFLITDPVLVKYDLKSYQQEQLMHLLGDSGQEKRSMFSCHAKVKEPSRN
ncbi:Scube1 [Symbiodinium natans]|uniref:Scube1 protein n=1 Tax=Symbiodinium natans TaxID=878477 RepID=A0A812V8V6_9DINO|nr:Scube1 [Symbiodinium natans]